MSVTLSYGKSGQFSCTIDPARVLACHRSPAPLADLAGAVREVLFRPLDFPPLARAVVPGDHVVLALDRHTPGASRIVPEVWRALEPQGIESDNIMILQPADWKGALTDPRVELPAEIQSRLQWKIHDPTDQSKSAYLATTASGERIYLARELVEADFVVSIGQLMFDPVLGYRGTNSVYYPGLSSSQAVARAHGEGHQELGPDDERGLRQMIDEVAWLLGSQFSIQVVASGGSGVAAVLAGLDQSVYRRGKEILADCWRIRLRERPQIVVAAVDRDAAGHGWPQLGAAFSAASKLVAKGGKVIALTDLDATDVDDGMGLIRDAENPRDALRLLRQQAPPDLIPATQLAMLADWANIYLLSKMDAALVEDLFMTPLESEREAERLLGRTGSCLFLEGAQHTYGEVSPTG